MSGPKSVFEKLKERGEEVFTQVSNELMSNEHFMKALQGAMRGKEKLEQGVSRTLKTMNIPTRTEFKRALSRIEALEKELSAVKAQPAPKPKAPRQRAPKAKAKAKAKAKPAPAE
jgi:polyhydroxyalkanoate synthesis regulator phasin